MRILMLLLLMVQFPMQAFADEKPATITVHGEAVTKTPPDQVTLPVTIKEENIKLKAAKEKHDEKLRELLKLAENTGIEKTNAQTRYTSINPLYDYIGNGQQKLRGYQVETSVDFKITDLLKLGNFINDVINLGITNIGNVSYSLSNEAKIKEDTLAQALENAHTKASHLASVAKLSVDKPLDIIEGEPMINRPIHPMYMGGVAMVAAKTMDSAAEMPTGLIEIHQSVTVTYLLK